MSVGLDIGTKSIKLIELSGTTGNFSLRSAGAVVNPGQEIDKGQDEKNLETIATAIRKLVIDTKLSTNEVFIGLPESQVFTRIIKFPLLNDQEIASAVKWEAEEYVPIPISEAVIEHQIVERKESGNPPQVLVLIIAVQKSLVEKYVNLATMAGLKVKGVETELFSLTRALAPNDKVSVIADMGARSSDIAIVKGTQLFFTRSLSMGGDIFSRAIAQSTGVQFTQAEEYKKVYGVDATQLEGKIARSLLPNIKVISEEIKKAMHFFQNESFGEAPTLTLLSGGSSALPGLIPEFAKTLGTEVVMGNTFGKVKVDPASAQSLANFQHIYAVATGLAMRE